VSATEAASPAEAFTPEPGGGDERRSRFGAFLHWLVEANTAVVTVLAVLLGLVVGAVLIIVTTTSTLHAWGDIGSDPGGAFAASWDVVSRAYGALLSGSIVSPSQVGYAISTGHGWTAVFTPISETMVSATPLIFAGTGVALGFATGVFNIGGQGQLIAGAICATYVGFGVHVPIGIHIPLVVLAGAAGGAVAGFIPGILKARTGAHEVIVTIMLNYVFLYLLAWLLTTRPLQQPGQSNTISQVIPSTARMPHLLGSSLRVNLSFLLALAAAGGVSWLMRRSTLGFRFRVIGSNPQAGRTAGMDAGLATILVLTISGALVGMAGMATLSGTDFFLSTGYGGENGFNAITVALLGRNKPLGVVLGSLLFAALETGGRYMQASTGVPIDLTSTIQAVIVFFVATPALVQEIFRLRQSGAGKILLFTKGWAG
jgi:ABC-type uncharacterized transport system permease subunit